ncbi:hypothetical protein [Bacillus paralicheniformis]|uniref:hypothetical protein n=1 Tax=Bacillus paralicheniformis TaxID=1648923 RepID=UPI0022438779|nr:hypothetical protein [Bacillus paralicheniformis]MEC1023559.1 hypothetical protein [Bacillus paralicheniformis]MEC1027427.1 hypothetical protein [Bacillus paralicheniformis]MEC1034391.1 hypothetical protein [Bacillus paralicheniformis]MEC1050227.1 hypothetical protein [Bacillus paralicheniformis]MEC1059836.1 hypothetical protein [Bacillus paralicheniformis]
MKYEEEIRNSNGTASALADDIHPLRKSFLLATAKIDSVLIAAGKRFVERIN